MSDGTTACAKNAGMMSDGWNHSLCEKCWHEEEPGREPARVQEKFWVACCKCGQTHMSGIYVRRAPDAYTADHQCKGERGYAHTGVQ